MIEQLDMLIERARGQVYGFFSSLFLNQPSPEMLNRLLGENGAAVWESMFPKHPACARMRVLSEAYLRGECQAEEFLLDYEALFRVPCDSYVHPFESAYIREGFSAGKVNGSTMMVGRTLEIAAIYREQDLSPREGFSELPDHLGVELELMALLCRKTAAALEKGDRQKAAHFVSRQRSFLEDHLLKWGPGCLDKVQKKGRTPLYACLADLLKAFLEEEGCSVCSHQPLSVAPEKTANYETAL